MGQIIYDMASDEYHGTAAIGSSGLKLMARSPLHYWAACLNPERDRDTQTPAQRLGTAYHTAIFEPERFSSEYAPVPEGIDRRTKEGRKLFQDIEESGAIPISSKDYATVCMMAEAGRSHPAMNVIFSVAGGAAEASMFFDDPITGAPCKIRPDYMIPPGAAAMFPHGLIVDGKSCGDARESEFFRDVWSYEYHTQAAFYVDGFQAVYNTPIPPKFIWLAQEKDVPGVMAHGVPDKLLRLGRSNYRSALDLYSLCKLNNTWPGYSPLVKDLALPVWAEKLIDEVGV
jgi:exodeoxyribonuclease VIII